MRSDKIWAPHAPFSIFVQFSSNISGKNSFSTSRPILKESYETKDNWQPKFWKYYWWIILVVFNDTLNNIHRLDFQMNMRKLFWTWFTIISIIFPKTLFFFKITVEQKLWLSKDASRYGHLTKGCFSGPLPYYVIKCIQNRPTNSFLMFFKF